MSADNVQLVSEDTFNLESLRLSQSFADVVGVKKQILTIPVRKPGPQDFVRVHPDPEMQFTTAVLELKEENEIYLVEQPLWAGLPNELTPKVLFTTINRQGVLTLWPISLPKEDGRPNRWHVSALEAAQLAREHWIRVKSNMSLGAYEVYQAIGDFGEPDWPDLNLQQILEIAFKDRFVRSVDHPVLKKLRGEL